MDDKLLQCVLLGVQMRDAQKTFYANRDASLKPGLLSKAKRLEKQFDDQAKYVLMLHEGGTHE